MEASERELVLSALSEQRGALGRVAWALDLRGPELTSLIATLGLGLEVDRVRERFRREALAPGSWTVRLDLFGRRKYLEDLGVERDFEDRLRGDLTRELHALGADGQDAPAAPGATPRGLAHPRHPRARTARTPSRANASTTLP